MLEFEKKVLLSKSEFDFLKRILKPTEIARQVNYYYDTDLFEMNKNGITCRIREKNGVYTAVIKEHQHRWQDCSIENVCFSGNIYNDKFFKAMGLSCQGTLYTERFIVSKGGIKIMLDKSKYLGITDYELELEYDSKSALDAITEMNTIASELYNGNIISSPKSFLTRIGQNDNKSARFYKRKNDIIKD